MLNPNIETALYQTVRLLCLCSALSYFSAWV
jgi:hypothetical protein